MEPANEHKQHWPTFTNLPELSLTQRTGQCFNKSSDFIYASGVLIIHD